jgi:hypothetical protein
MDKSDLIIKKIDALTESVDKRFDAVDKRFGASDKKIDDLTDVVIFIKDRMATKEELREVEERLGNRIIAVEGKVDGVYNLIDQEVDKRKALEVRTTKLEAGSARQ